jgi:hypothetical protein
MLARSIALARPLAPRLRSLLELGAVGLTAVAHLSWPALGLPRALLVVPLVLGWGAYVAHRARHDPEALSAWGLRREGLWPTAAVCAVVLAVGGAAMGAYGAWAGHALPWWSALCLLTYPIWGLVQQLLLQGLVTRNLAALPRPVSHPVAVTLLSSTAFGLVHWHQPPLVLATFALGLVLTPLWLRWRNLWPMAFLHGWAGTLVYYLVLGSDPVLTYFSAGG